MSKTLYVGIYDSLWEYKGYELIDNEFVDINLSYKDAYCICRLNTTDDVDEIAELYKSLSNDIKKYDTIIYCEDSVYKIMNLSKTGENKNI